MSKLGAHIVSGSRNGYGEFCAGKPAVVVAVDEGGALAEAKQKSNGYTVTIFRQTSVYLEAPPDFNTYPDMVQLAQYWYQQLRPKWAQNPADYYTITNEIGGNDEAVLTRLVAYEREVMRLANGDGLEVCILNLAGGSPGDIAVWKRVCLPFIVEAWQDRNIYGRHTYGGDLVNPDGSVVIGNPSRPFEELGHLRAAGAAGGMVITEAGIDGGFGFAGVERFTQQLTGYEKLLRPFPEIIGCCAWTLGDWQEKNANCQDALPALTQYLIANPTPKWEWPGQPVDPVDPPPVEPPPPSTPKHVVIQSPAGAGNVRLKPATTGNTPIGTVPNGTVFEVVEDIANWYAVKVYVSKIVAKVVEDVQPLPPPEFTLASPVKGIPLYVTDWFNTPRSYMGNHEGLDLRATNNAGLPVPILAAADGIVDGIRATDPGTGYGIYVRLRHERPGVVWKTWYCHLGRVADGLQVGAAVLTGRELGTAGSTGNSTGVHLHLTVQKIPGGLSGYVITDVVDPAPLLGLSPAPAPNLVDLLPYLRGDGRIYTVRHPDGNQEDFQSQSDGNVFYQVKNSQYEALKYDDQWIYRGLDTSPGPAPGDAERPGALRYYGQFEPGQEWAKWCPRYMTVGEVWTGTGHHVQFAYKSDCAPSAKNSGGATNKATFVAKHPSKAWGGVVVQDVIELKVATGETMFYGRGYGLVGWGAEWGSSGIVELSPAGRPPLEREVIPCL